jgi:hypothetical protein
VQTRERRIMSNNSSLPEKNRKSQATGVRSLYFGVSLPKHQLAKWESGLIRHVQVVSSNQHRGVARRVRSNRTLVISFLLLFGLQSVFFSTRIAVGSRSGTASSHFSWIQRTPSPRSLGSVLLASPSYRREGIFHSGRPCLKLGRKHLHFV